MASRIFDRLWCLGRARVDICGSFKPNGANATVGTKKGNGFSVTHTPGGGVYTVTFEDKYVDTDACIVTCQSATAGQVASYSVEPGQGTQTLTITLIDSATKTPVVDAALDPNLRIHFWVRFKNTSGNF